MKYHYIKSKRGLVEWFSRRYPDKPVNEYKKQSIERLRQVYNIIMMRHYKGKKV